MHASGMFSIIRRDGDNPKGYLWVTRVVSQTGQRVKPGTDMSEDHLPPEFSIVGPPEVMVSTSESLPTGGIKRRASISFEGMQDDSRKRLKERPEIGQSAPADEGGKSQVIASTSTAVDLVEDLYDELSCGCCSGLLYRPVMVSPCQHFFCGSCVVQWIRNGGTHCPACRGVSTIVSPSRPLQIVIDALLRAAPHKARTERERLQADEIYKGGINMRIPAPREASPEPNLNLNGDYARPCPHCLPNNPYRWTCPQPIPDPNTDVDHAWHLEDGVPPGHTHCGNCEVLMALQAPSTTKCDFCHSSFCGISVPGRCVAVPVIVQHLHGMADVGDLIQCTEVYECFNGNTVEVDFMLDYMTAQGMTPKHIYKDIVSHIKIQPRQFAPLIEQDIFLDNASDPNQSSESPRESICRRCATEIFFWGLKDWWVRERQKGFVEEAIAGRKDCPNGPECARQRDLGHAKEFNHIFSRPAQALPSRTEQTEVPIVENSASVAVDVSGEHPLPMEGDVIPSF
ncbi:ring finger domain-containing protein [Moniliophthora roreri MCA 2997]|uniref:Ring finger domain-containing protein n=1 Tax=Moniliophthora roreri (strain MCA 2997) TaxID=1381753 RepID=V2WYK4_MONRO|nr:ring finger domain-containing protein [Moniliophthora roreri MCA 2997]